MSKRNFILLTIFLVIVIIAVFGFLFMRQSPTTPVVDNTGTNFISQFNPFGNSTTTTPPSTNTPPPVDISGDQPPTNPDNGVKLQLNRISSMPVAGFIVYAKERLKDVGVVAPTPTPSNPPYNFGAMTLKNGSKGEEVKEIQRFLNTVLSINLILDGVFNAEVTTEVKKWQTDHGITSDGIVGAKTKLTMYASVNQTPPTATPTAPLTEFVPALRYVDRATGNIYQTFADKIEERKFSGTVIPKIYEAFFGNKGESVIMRYLKTDGRTIETFVGTLPKEFLGGDTTENNEVKGTLLPENVRDVSVSSDTSNIFYLFNVGENVVGTTLNLITNKRTQIFDSPFTEWTSLWPNNKIITLTTKPSSSVPGYIYGLDPSNKNLNQILGNINGLTTLTSPDGRLVLYGNDNLSLSVYHTDTKLVEPVGVRTLPEKCVWGKVSDIIYCAVPKSTDAGGYPDSWYQGEVSFSDQIWKINILSGSTAMIADVANLNGGGEVDGIKLALDEGENYLFFVNKKDSFLWELVLR